MYRTIVAFTMLMHSLSSSIALADMSKAHKYFRAKNYTAALQEYMIDAKKGNRDAQYIIAQLYASGEGVERNLREAVSWYSIAADRGHAKAQYNIALIYLSGRGVAQNSKIAAQWLRRAVDNDNPHASLYLGELYQNGDDVVQDYKHAYDHYYSSAVAGVQKSMNNLGYLYFNGQGVDQDYQIAYMWFSVADFVGNSRGKIHKFDMRQLVTDQQKSKAERDAHIWLQNNPQARIEPEPN